MNHMVADRGAAPLHRHNGPIQHDHALVVFRPQLGQRRGRKGFTPKQGSKQGPLIARRVDRLEQGIEVVAQLLGEHGLHGGGIGSGPPLLVEIDRARAGRIGSVASPHGTCRKHFHRRQRR